MRRVAVLGALCVLVAVTVGADAAPLSFRYGVAAGEVTSTSALLWTRLPRAGTFELETSRSRSFAESSTAQLCCGRAADDLTVSVPVRGLEPATRYWYRFRQGSLASRVGTFVTAPRRSADAEIRFAVTGDADATPDSNGKPAFGFGVYARMAAERNHFNINLGDTIYSDSGVGGAPFARTAAQKWGKYKLGLARPELRRLRGSASLYSHWGDHEFVNNFSRAEHGAAVYRAGVRAFRDYAPVRFGRNGLYRAVRWGRNLELFFLDERSFRSPEVTSPCDDDDLAPTAPQSVRNRFANLSPSLRRPVPAGCLAAIEDPARTMLGARQFAAFTRAIAASSATWKVVVTEVPIQQFYVDPYDRWEGYAAERRRVLRFLRRNAENVVFLATDAHANLVNRVRLRTLGGTPDATAMWEVVTGPAATNTFARSVDRDDVRGGAAALASVFFKPPPPNGLGMRCAALDTRSYAQVTVTARTLTVASRDARGRLVREATGRACAPLVLRAR
jgi:alkaline phosphatase D